MQRIKQLTIFLPLLAVNLLANTTLTATNSSPQIPTIQELRADDAIRKEKLLSKTKTELVEYILEDRAIKIQQEFQIAHLQRVIFYAEEEKRLALLKRDFEWEAKLLTEKQSTRRKIVWTAVGVALGELALIGGLGALYDQHLSN